jgi:hypothetical protein
MERKAPTNPTEVRAFLRLAGYYRNFFEGFSTIARPMTQLLKKDKKFKWTEKCNQSFQELKKRLVSAPILTMPDITKSFDVYCAPTRPGRHRRNRAHLWTLRTTPSPAHGRHNQLHPSLCTECTSSL